MTRLGFDGLVSGAEHSKDDAGLGMRWDFLDIPLGFDLEDGVSCPCFFKHGYFWIVSVQICHISGVFIKTPLLLSGPSMLYFNF